MTYNGHKNWNHWNVSLWMTNNEQTYRFVCDALRRGTKEQTARYLAALWAGETTPDGAPYTYTAIRAALVGWEC